MSNRTNQTLSANTNGLNLGTRSLALVACANDKATLRFRLAHLSHPGVVARSERMRFVPSISMPAYGPAKPDPKRGTYDTDGFKLASSSLSILERLLPSWQTRLTSWTQGQVVFEVVSVVKPSVVRDFRATRALPQSIATLASARAS